MIRLISGAKEGICNGLFYTTRTSRSVASCQVCNESHERDAILFRHERRRLCLKRRRVVNATQSGAIARAN